MIKLEILDMKWTLVRSELLNHHLAFAGHRVDSVAKLLVKLVGHTVRVRLRGLFILVT